MKILFSMRHVGAIRNFLSTIRGLAERGHHIHLAFIMPEKLGAESSLWDLTDEFPNITHTDPASKRYSRFWLFMARGVRFWADYLRYLDPAYRDADKLRERAADRLPQFLIRFSSLRPGQQSARAAAAGGGACAGSSRHCRPIGGWTRSSPSSSPTSCW